MTDHDATAALAAALHDSYLRDPAMPRIYWSDLSATEQAIWKRHAEAIIAALAAAGWRLTSAPRKPEPIGSDPDNEVSAGDWFEDDPASAQAVPVAKMPDHITIEVDSRECQEAMVAAVKAALGKQSLIGRLRMWLAERAFLLAGWLDETYAVWIDDAPRRRP